jgi:hypothetical protein
MVDYNTPSTDNYFIGKGICTIQTTDPTVFNDMGNCPEVEFTPSTDTLDHFSSREGVKTKDKTVVLSKGGELRILMEELTDNNLALLLCGSVDRSTKGQYLRPQCDVCRRQVLGDERGRTEVGCGVQRR